MYLKALELKGFKSFPERTRLNFTKPITAIVGPNGSGKSNIADALQWVMGEQSTKALRGGKMEDVIFGGTEKRGQVGFAEVTLVLDNEDRALSIDADEVEVTRRYYRSGESEYIINKNSVRLRDVNELFMDTGLGRDGYSIIGQGKIDSILSAKSTDRREIFEEAAGISRYRYRKEESERKLQYAEDDLLRVNDKISELELQVEPLRKQSKVAKQYLIYRDELKGLEVSLWLSDLERIGEELKSFEQDSIAAQGELERAASELDNLNKQRDELTEKLHSCDIEAENIRGNISGKEETVSRLQSSIAVLKTQLGHNEENIRRINDEINLQDGQSSGIMSQILERKNKIEGISKERQEIEKQLSDLAVKTAQIEDRENTSRQKISELASLNESNTKDISDAKNRLSSLAAYMQETDDREQGTLSLIQDETDKAEQYKKNIEELKSVLKEKNERSIGFQNALAGYRMRLEDRKKKLEAESDKRSELQVSYNTVRSRRQMLVDMEREYEGYSRAVKAIMRQAGRGAVHGIHGPAGDLLKTDDKYALAIETAMGAAMQNVIVSTEDDGKNAISILKRLDAGRVTFLPMNVIHGVKLDNPTLKYEQGFEGIAFDLVSFDSKYKNIYLNILGRTAIVDTMDSAIRIARKNGHKFRIVTLDGQVINAGGSMTGGSVSKNVGIISRANEVSSLKEEENKLQASLGESMKVLDKLKRETNQAEYEVDLQSRQLKELGEETVKVQAEIQHYNLVLESIEEHIKNLKNDRENFKSKNEELDEECGRINEKIKILTSEGDRLRQLMAEENDALTAALGEKSELLREESSLKAKAASLDAEKNAENSAVNDLDLLRREITGSREKQKAALASLHESTRQAVSDIENQEYSNKEKKKSIANLRIHLTSVTECRLQMEAQRDRTDKLITQKNERIRDLDRNCERIVQKQQMSQKDEKLISDKLWDTYGLTRTTAMQQKVELESISQAKRRVNELHQKISALGTPNLGAIEEFERVNTRYTFLTDQRNDIEQSRRELLDIIKDITSQMRDIFITKFDEINVSFKKTFSDLFGGGKCELELEDTSDVLNCGIDIRVQPPGKSLKTITLLSGGEKAFVAIALYYAILKVRPTPFVIMDEIEAALDEVNVVKTSKYMRRLTGKTQFLVITHRRGTMEEADVLFGVTMQEKGVSKVLMMDLEEAEKTIGKE